MSRATEAKEQTIVGEEKEQIALAWSNAKANSYLEEREISANDLNNEFNINGINAIAEGEGTIIVNFDTGNKYKITNGQVNIIETAPEDALKDWEYSINENTIYLNKYIGNNPEVIVYGIYEIDGMQYNTNLSRGETSIFGGKSDIITSIKIKEGVKSENCKYLFQGLKNVNFIDIGGLDTSGVENMEYMFYACSKLEKVEGLTNLNTSNVTNMYDMFGLCSKLTGADLSSFDTAKVTDMMWMFLYCYELEEVSIGSGWDTSNVTNMYEMFYCCYKLKSIDTANWNTSKVSRMAGMFDSCESLETLDLSNWSNAATTDMGFMFGSCTSLKNINLSNFYTDNVSDMYGMFQNCTTLSSLDLRSFSTKKVKDMRYMFKNCTGLENIYVGEKWDTTLASTTTCYGSEVSLGTTGMFDDCGVSQTTSNK